MNLPWEEHNVVYTFTDGWGIEEIKTPWDLFLEGRLMDHCSGQDNHRFAVKIGDEVMFSLRDPEGYPFVTFLTQPEGARDWWGYGILRGLGTSVPMVINDRKLVVLEATAKGNKQIDDPEVYAKVVEFYTYYGGVMNYKHPNGTVFENMRLYRKFKKREKWYKQSLLVSASQNRTVDFRTRNAEEARMALVWSGPWGTMYLDNDLGEAESGLELLSWLTENLWALPQSIHVISKDNVDDMQAIIDKLYVNGRAVKKFTS